LDEPVNDVGLWAAGLSDANLVSETDVRTRVVVPLLEMLGYPEANRAEEFPVFGYEARNPLKAKRADVLTFDSAEHHLHRNQAARGWIEDHALLVVELKRPGESLEDARDQAQFYARWAKVPFYALTDGMELVVFRMQGFLDDVREFARPLPEIPRHWGLAWLQVGTPLLRR
jgi:hypothetical protein